MELTPIYKRVIGLDVHQAQITACAIMQQSDGTVVIDERQFGGFKRDRTALADWARSIEPEVIVMESTGIYWKSPFAALERVGNLDRCRSKRGSLSCNCPIAEIEPTTPRS